LRVYTTLDPALQSTAIEAVRKGLKAVDEQLAAQERFEGQTPPEAQAALVVLDQRTGAVKALVGGRDYRLSQFNRALSRRQPGSTFKPFVYAAALETGLPGEPAANGEVFTTASLLQDAPISIPYKD